MRNAIKWGSSSSTLGCLKPRSNAPSFAACLLLGAAFGSICHLQVFVAGASGASGRQVVKLLAAKGISVRSGVRVSSMFLPALLSGLLDHSSLILIRYCGTDSALLHPHSLHSPCAQNVEKARAADWAKAGRVDIVYADLSKDTE